MNETTETKPPAKKWRVRLTGGGCQDFRTQPAAYEGVQTMVRADLGTVTVEHWENDRWGLYERIEPVTVKEA